MSRKDGNQERGRVKTVWFDRLIWRRLRVLAALAEAPGTVAREVLMRAAGLHLYGPTPETSARLFYMDLAWLRVALLCYAAEWSMNPAIVTVAIVAPAAWLLLSDHRRLDARTYASKCSPCIWGCCMPVEMIIDPWNPSARYRFETFCYGPKSCDFYRAGPARQAPGRKEMTYTEEDWVDEDATAHRWPDE
jgi:hypothetical protein